MKFETVEPKEENVQVIVPIVEDQPKEEPKKTRKPRAPKARTFEELKDVAVSKMTDKEKEVMINGLKEKLTAAETKAIGNKKLAESSLEKVRLIEQQMEALRSAINKDLGYVRTLTSTFAESMFRTLGGNN